MRRIALCAVVCLSLSGALVQARVLPSKSSSSSTVHQTSSHHSKPHAKAKKHSKPQAKAKKHSKKQTVSKLTTATAAPSIAVSGSATLFGDTAVESGLDSNSAGWAEAFPFTSQGAGKVSAISVYLASQNKATSLIAGIYSNSNGNPGSLLTTGTLTSPKAGAWNKVTVAAASIKSGKYWIALLGRGGVLYFDDRSDGSCQSQNSSQMSATSLSSTWPTGGPTWASCPVSAYVIGSPTATATSTGGSGSGTTTTTTTTTTPTTTSAPTPPTLPTLLPPVSVLAPSVSGTAVDGQTLTTTNGTWLDTPSSYTYQWQDCSGSTCTNVVGATAGTYRLADTDIGKTVRAVVTASNDAGSASADSAASSSVGSPPAPANTAPPSVSGSATQGQSLSTSNGTWSGSPTMLAYSWQDCNSSGSSCSAIAGATGSQYTLGSGDVGHTVRSVVTASNAGGSNSATSAATAVITAPATAPSNTALPAVSGSAIQGQSLSTSNGTWSGSPTMLAYSWQDCNSSGSSCSAIAGATGSQYTLGSGDVGHTVRSVVTASNAGGSNSATSAATAVITAPATAPSNTALPAVSGSAIQGQSLSTSNGTWSGSPTMLAYSWQDCNSSGSSCSAIAGATGSQYTLGSGDVGHTVRSVVTASNAGGSNSATSAATAVITAPATAPSNTALPAVSGTTIQGQSLSTSNGSWSGNPASFSYKWQDCNSSGASCTNISGATGGSYTLGSGDLGHTIRSVVTATNSAGSTAATSAQTAAVGASVTAPSNTAAPTVSGTGVQGSTLTTSNGSWSGSTPSYAYQWQDCNTSGSGCANIAGATTSSYTLQAGDVGDTVRSVVTASNSGGSSSAPSAASATIIASGGGGGGGGGGGTSSYTCTQHVTTSTFSSAFSSAGSGAVLCLAPGNYGSFNGSSKSSMVVITPDVAAGATAPVGNATGDVNGNVTFSGVNFSPAANITMDGVTFTGDVTVAGASHDLLFHDSLFHEHLVITDPLVTNGNVTADYDMFPADKADCINGPEGRIWLKNNGHGTPGGVTIENNNIGGTTSQCDAIQTGAYGPQILNNWIHDYHYENSAHTDGIQDYGGSHEVVKGNFMYNTPDCYVSYDGTDHADVEDNICVNDGSQSNGASPNDLDVLGDTGSIIKHNTVVAFKDTYNNTGGCITLGAKSGKSTGTVITDNIATCLVTDSGGVSASYSENHNMWVSSGPSGSGDLHSTPTYGGGSCASLSSSQSPFCTDSWSNYLLTASSAGNNAADDGTDLGAYGAGPVTPGGPA